MEFFIPNVKKEKTQLFYDEIINYVKTYGHQEISDEKIYSLEFTKKTKQYSATVGESLYIEPENHGIVIAILKATIDLYYVCSSHRGALKNEPFSVGSGNVINIQLFQ